MRQHPEGSVGGSLLTPALTPPTSGRTSTNRGRTASGHVPGSRRTCPYCGNNDLTTGRFNMSQSHHVKGIYFCVERMYVDSQGEARRARNSL